MSECSGSGEMVRVRCPLRDEHSEEGGVFWTAKRSGWFSVHLNFCLRISAICFPSLETTCEMRNVLPVLLVPASHAVSRKSIAETPLEAESTPSSMLHYMLSNLRVWARPVNQRSFRRTFSPPEAPFSGRAVDISTGAAATSATAIVQTFFFTACVLRRSVLGAGEEACSVSNATAGASAVPDWKPGWNPSSLGAAAEPERAKAAADVSRSSTMLCVAAFCFNVAERLLGGRCTAAPSLAALASARVTCD